MGTHFVTARELPYLQDEIMNMENPSAASVSEVLDSYHAKCADNESKFSLQEKLDRIDSIFCPNTVEGILENLKEDGSEWAMKIYGGLRKMSPSSMKVTLKQLKAGRHMSFKDVLEMEYRISQRCMV